MKSYRHFFLALLLTGFALLLILSNCKRKKPGDKNENTDVPGTAAYVGRESCKECHESQYHLFLGSDHDQAMQPATEEFVLGDFNDVTFSHFGVDSKFTRRAGKFYVYTQGPEGKMQEYEIKYTFGVRPLQQYLIEFPGGRYQCLPLCWDTRPKEQGGQRWFHVYGDEEIKPDDVLYWTKILQNWNYMCSECHSTNLRKNYNFETKNYHTTWSEIDVSCEACHGPGSDHLKWADIVENGGDPESFPDMGLAIRLKDTDNASWVFDPDSVTARRSVARDNDNVVQMCARCHSRRSVITEDYFYGGSLLNTHWPSLLEEGLYYPDGQILDEVYVYGSFLQSKMYMAGVNCKDCHEPHSGKIYVQGNALCYRCHLASEFGGRKHHFHDPAKEGASCYECHMHENTYMQIDPRRDHSIRVPRPDLSEKLGTPNACNQCHADKSVEWATGYLKKWYGDKLLSKPHYGEVFFEARKNYPSARKGLTDLAVDKKTATMVRATAISLLGNYPGEETDQFLGRMMSESNPLIRYAALSAIQYREPSVLLSYCLPLMSDSIKLIRIMAGYILSVVPEENIPEGYKNLRAETIEEYKASLLINSDHPNTHMNYGNLYLNLGDLAKAESSYREAIHIEPGLVSPYVNLADLYRRQGREEEGEKILRQAIDRYPEIAALQYSIGLLEVRKKNNEMAMPYLKKAAELEPGNAQYNYVYAIGLNSLGKPAEALEQLKKAVLLNPYDTNLLYTLVTLNLERGNPDEALKYARILAENYPGNENFRLLLQSLEKRGE